MFIIIGIVVVFGCVIGGFVIEGGPLPILLQGIEFMIIAGAATGALLISVPLPALKAIISRLIGTLKGDKFTKDSYLDLLKTMYEVFQVARRDGVIGLEKHVEKPEESAIFQKNPFFLGNHAAVAFLTDTLKMLLSTNLTPFDLDSMMDLDIETHHKEVAGYAGVVQKIGDSLPGLGIVAAVLGIIITMGAIAGPAEAVGEHVAVALVGTFLGILLSYGLVQPLATNMEFLLDKETGYLQCIKTGLIAFSKDFGPSIAVEFARRSIGHSVRPDFADTEAALKATQAPPQGS